MTGMLQSDMVSGMTGTTIFDEQHAGGVAPIVAALEDEIVSSRWPAGSKLPSERNLAEMLGVSRPMIREALRVLNERGLIHIYAGRGSFVQRTGPPTTVRAPSCWSAAAK